MKRLFLSLTFACLGLFVSTQAQTPAGYAIFGDVPYGYTDLTSAVEVSTTISGGGDAISASDYSSPISIAYTGKGLGGSYVCHQNIAVALRFTENTDMILTDKMAIHLKMKRTDENTTGGSELSLCKSHWGGDGKRLSFEIANTAVTSELSEVVLNYSSYSTKGTYSTYGQGDLIGGQTFPGGNGYELFRINAVSGEAFEITQIYIDADATAADPVAPVAGDEDAPTSLTLAASNIRDNNVTLTASATDANSPITYTFYYKAEGAADFTAVAGSVAAASGADAVKVVTSLAPETTYSFKVVATDPNSNSADYSISGITTLVAFKHRFYFFRGGDIPEIDGVVSVDLREGVGTTITCNNMAKTDATEYTGYTLNGNWLSFNQNLSATTDMSIVSQSSWYLCIKMRTTVNQSSFNLRLNNAGECWMISTGNLSLEHDGTWETLALPLSTSSKTLTFTASMTGTIFQMHANGSAASDYIDIEYAYLTDDPVTPEKPAIVDEEAPANFSVTEKPAATTFSSTTLQLYAEDEDTPITYTIRYAVKNSGDTPTEVSVNGSQGSTVEKTISGLAPETTYTFSVVASDPNGNETSPVVLDITTAAFAAQRYYLCRGDNSDFPSSASVTSTYVDCNVEFGNNAYADNRADYLSVVSGNNTWTAITFKPKATAANDIDDDWYIVVRFRSNFSNNVFWGNHFRLNLSNNAENWYVRIDDGEEPFGVQYNSNQWITLKKRIGDRRDGSAVPASFLVKDQIAVQLHVSNNLIAGENIDIDYIYFTNDITDIDEGTDDSRRIKLDESKDISNNFFGIADNTPLTIDLQRSFIADGYWYTLCLPCSMTAEQIADAFGTCRIAHLSNSVLKSEDALYLDFEDVNTITAGQPYLFLPSADVINPLLCGTYRQNASRTNNHNYAGMTGVYAPTDMSGMSDAYLLTTENTLAPVSGGTLKGFRAYFTLSTTPANGAPARIRFVTDTATSVDAITTISADKVIENGQLYIIRNGMKYNIQGQIVEPVK